MKRPAWLCLCCLLLIGPGCSTSPTKYKPQAGGHASEDISLNSEQMRRRVRALVQPMSGLIVASADEIMAGTTDRAIRREALLWKIEAVPALREALFRADPIVSLVDAWMMSFQMTDYFENGPGAKALGKASEIAVTTSRHLEAEIAGIAASATHSGDVSDVRDRTRKLAADHPIRHSIAGRESLPSLVSDRHLADSIAPGEAVGNLMVSADDLNRRLEIYSAQLPEQSRWQAELFAMDLAREYQLEKAIPLAESAAASARRATEAIDRSLPAMQQSLAVVEKTPALFATEREEAIKAFSAEMARITAFIREERVAALKQVTIERTTATQDLGDSLARERKLLAGDIERIALEAADRAIYQAAQLSVLLLVAVFFCGVLLLLIARRVFRGPPPGSHRLFEKPAGPA